MAGGYSPNTTTLFLLIVACLSQSQSLSLLADLAPGSPSVSQTLPGPQFLVNSISIQTSSLLASYFLVILSSATVQPLTPLLFLRLGIIAFSDSLLRTSSNTPMLTTFSPHWDHPFVEPTTFSLHHPSISPLPSLLSLNYTNHSLTYILPFLVFAW